MEDVETQQPEGWHDVVAAVLSLVVQHCPSASKDPRDLCTLLQVSTACRTALQRSKGHCCPSLKVQGQRQLSRLISYADWAAQHNSLVLDLSVAIESSKLSLADGQLRAAVDAVAALSSLKSFSIEGRRVFNQSLLGSLAPHAQLKGVSIDIAAVDALACIPPCVSTARLVVDVSTQVSGADELTGPSALSFQHLAALQDLDLCLWTNPSVHVHLGTAVDVSLPSGLTRLCLAGPVCAVECEQQQSGFPDLEVFVTSGDSMPIDRLAQLIGSMPRLRNLCLDGAPQVAHDGSDIEGAMLQDVSVEQACVLAAAVGGATQLTALCIEEYYVDVNAGGPPGLWGDLKHLTGLGTLDLGVELCLGDVQGIATLTQLTLLRLSSCGYGVTDQAVAELCHGLLGLCALVLNGSGVEDCELLFESVARLTDLTMLCLEDNHEVVCGPEQLHLLWPLVRLERLTLPPTADEYCVEEEIREMLMDHLPLLCCVRAGVDEYWG